MLNQVQRYRLSRDRKGKVDLQPESSVRTGPTKYFFLFFGFIFSALGFIGIAIPGLPTTVFMILAASCFTKSSPRFERWILNLPVLGRMVIDFRSGLGMPLRIKVIAVTMMTVTVTSSTVFFLSNVLIRLLVILVGLIGVWYVCYRVPTREKVLEQRSQEKDR